MVIDRPLRSRYPRTVASVNRYGGGPARRLENLGIFARFTRMSVVQIGWALHRYRRETLRLIAEIGMGTGAMAIIGGTVAIIGFVTLSGSSLIAIQGFASLGNIGVEAFTGFFAALANTRIAAPIVSGVALAATVGAGATAQLGAMRISEEIDALEVMGIKSISFLVSTRIVGGLVVIGPLYALALDMAFTSGQLVTTVLYGQSNGTYEHYFRTFLRAEDVAVVGRGGRDHRGGGDDQSLLLRVHRQRRPGRRRPRRRSIDAPIPGLGRGCRPAGRVGALRRRPELQSHGVTAMTTVLTLKGRRLWLYLEGVVLLAVGALVLVLVYGQFRGNFTPKTELTLVAPRAGLVMEPGAKVTYNGVAIGRVASISETSRDGKPAAKLMLEVDPKYVKHIPANVLANVEAATLFGNKYVSLISPKNPQPRPISSDDVIDVDSVTTEFNTLFETITSLAEKVDPIELNATLSALAQSLDGLGGKFGAAIVDGNQILAQLNPRIPQLGYDVRRLADLGDIYNRASPDLWAALQNAVITARSLTKQQSDLDAALLAAVGAGRTGEDIFTRAGPFLVRGATDLVPTAELLDTYSPELFCMIRNFHDAAPKVANALGGNGYSLSAAGTILGAPNPYVYPDNLPRINAHGGPGGRPGCWQTITRDLWPAPYLVMDTGASLAPYNHLELGQPMFTEYVWGRQYGENTINP